MGSAFETRIADLTPAQPSALGVGGLSGWQSVRTAIVSACLGRKKSWPGRLEEVGIEDQLQVAGLGWLSCDGMPSAAAAVLAQYLLGCLTGRPATGAFHSARPRRADRGKHRATTAWGICLMNLRPLVFALLLLALILAAADLLVVTISILLLIFAGLLFGVFIHGLASWVARRTPVPYRYTYFLVVGILVAMLSAGFFYLGTQIAQRAGELWSQLESSAQNSIERLSQYEWAQQYLPDASQWQKMLEQQGDSALPMMLSGVQWITWGLTGALVIFFVGLYAAYEPGLYRTGVTKLVPMQRRARGGEVLDQLRSAMGKWIVGRIMSMLIVGVLTAIGLAVLGVPLPLTLGVVAALLTFIPNIGPLLAAVPQILLALNMDTQTAIYVLILNIVLQGLESYLITPMIQRHEVTLPPILTISAQLLMGVLFGVIGIMMAAPLVVVLMVVMQMLYVQDRLGDEHPGKLTE